MASFLSILKGIGHVFLGVEHVAAPIAEAIFPQFAVPIAAFDKFVTDTHTAIAVGEMQSPVGGGAQKSQLAIDAFDASLATIQEVLASQGKIMQYDPAKLQAAINTAVANFQSWSDLKATFKIVDTPKGP